MMKRNGISEEGLSTSVRSTHLPTPPVGRVPSHPGNDYVADLEARVKGFIGAEPNDFARAAVLLGPVTAELIPLCVPPPRRR